jgi:hypothetical protein
MSSSACAAEAAATTEAAAACAAFTSGTTGCATGATTAWAATARLDCENLAALAWGHNAFTLSLLAGQLARAAHGFSLLADALLGWLFKVPPELHLTEYTLALQLLLQRFESLINVVIANLDEHPGKPRF